MTDAMFETASKAVTRVSTKAIKGSRLGLLLLAAMFASVLPAQAQSGDTWKSVVIIGGSTAAGAYIGHKVGGTTGAYVGAAVGASAGYAIDRRRRQNEYNNYPYGEDGYYGNNGGYNGNDYPYSGNDGGYYPDSRNSYPDDGYYGNDNRQSRRRR